MCIIIDADCQGDFINRHEDMLPLHRWIKNGGKIVYSPVGKLKTEATPNFKKELERLYERGRAKLIEPQDVLAKQSTLTGLKSNDAHIIALALVAGVRVLVSKDEKLKDDFKEHTKGRGKKDQGKIYKNARQKCLLKKDLCP